MTRFLRPSFPVTALVALALGLGSASVGHAAGEGRPTAGAAPDREIRPAPTGPEAAPAPSGTLRKATPEAKAAETRRRYTLLPVVESALIVPDGNYAAGIGLLAPRSRLILAGKAFGDGGSLRLQGLPGGDGGVTLQSWSDTRIEVRLPDTKYTGIGDIEARRNVQAVVHRDEDQKQSAPYALQFGWPFELRNLKVDDPAVTVVRCGDDGNANTCNRVKTGGGCATTAALNKEARAPLPTLFGYHRNCSGAIGDDEGIDTYDVKLRNGWKVRRVADSKEHKSSSGEHVGNLKAWGAADDRRFSVDWRVTPGDEISYQHTVEIVGPMGRPHR